MLFYFVKKIYAFVTDPFLVHDGVSFHSMLFTSQIITITVIIIIITTLIFYIIFLFIKIIAMMFITMRIFITSIISFQRLL